MDGEDETERAQRVNVNKVAGRTQFLTTCFLPTWGEKEEVKANKK